MALIAFGGKPQNFPNSSSPVPERTLHTKSTYMRIKIISNYWLGQRLLNTSKQNYLVKPG